LFRFAFPDFKLFDMVSEGIDAKALSEADMKKSLFNGNGMWLKGHVMSWYPEEVRAFIRRAHEILVKHWDVLTSGEPQPLIRTEQEAVLANRFSSRDKVLFTLFNDSFRTVRGRMLRIPDEYASWKCVNQWNGAPLELERDSSGAYVVLELGPKDVGAISLQSH
jgi:hypothetical protein